VCGGMMLVSSCNKQKFMWWKLWWTTKVDSFTPCIVVWWSSQVHL